MSYTRQTYSLKLLHSFLLHLPLGRATLMPSSTHHILVCLHSMSHMYLIHIVLFSVILPIPAPLKHLSDYCFLYLLSINSFVQTFAFHLLQDSFSTLLLPILFSHLSNIQNDFPYFPHSYHLQEHHLHSSLSHFHPSLHSLS